MKMHIYKEPDEGVKICSFEGEFPCFCLDKTNCICFFKDKHSTIISTLRLAELSLQVCEVKEVDSVVYSDYLYSAQNHRIKLNLEKMKDNPLFLKPYREGIGSAIDGCSREANPYEDDSLEHDFWDVGYFHRTDY